MENDDGTPWTERLRDAWTRFLLSLLVRNPETLVRLRHGLLTVAETGPALQAEYERSIRQPGNPESYVDALRALRPDTHSGATLGVVGSVMNGALMSTTINAMKWFVSRLKASVTLLTSDRPLVMTGTLGHEHARIALPIGPNCLFIGARSQDSYLELRQRGDEDIVREVNATVVGQAAKYVWGRDDGQLRFVQNRMGGTPLRNLFPLLE